MNTSMENETSAAQQAYEWFDALRSDNPQRRAEFAAWLKASPQHVGEFLAITALYREYSGFDPQRQIDVDALLAETASNVVPLDEMASVPAGRTAATRRKLRISAIAASVLGAALIVGLWLATTLPDGRRYANEVGEIRSFELDDGSVIHLNTASNVQVRFTDESREVRLIAGEALFKVARDPLRPFRVHSGDAAIEALGTQFNVRKRAEGITVSVIEGAVRVTSRAISDAEEKLTAGQEVRVAANGTMARIAKVDAVKVTAWRERRLIFRNDTLEDIAAEFNRYNEKPRFRIEGAATAAMRFTGVFDAEAPESFVRVLGGVGQLSAQRQGDEVVIRERKK